MRRMRLRLPFLLLLVAVLHGCAGHDLLAVKRADSRAEVPAGSAVLHGRIRFVVDGQPMRYGFWNKPYLQLFDRRSGLLMPTPEADANGRFAWQLPAGDYGVSVIFGGMSPAGSAHRQPNGALVYVNGLVDPGLELAPQAGARLYVGTIEVAVSSRLPASVIRITDERVFDRLLGVRVVDEAAAERAQGLPAGLQTQLVREIRRSP